MPFGSVFKKSSILVTVIIGSLFVLTACQTTSPRDELVFSGFLTEYSNLQPMPGSDSALYYEKEKVNWEQYNRILIQPVPVQVKDSTSATISERDGMMLGSYFHMSMKKAVKKKYLLADEIEGDVLVVRVTINELPGKNDWVIIEGELLDGNTGEPLVAIVDSKKSTLSSSFSKWNDVTLAFDQWADQLYQLLNKHMGNRVITDNAKTVIAKILKQADTAFRNSNLTTPVGHSAVDYYQKILIIEPGNSQALEGISKVSKQYVEWAEFSFKEGDLDMASQYLDEARNISVDEQALLDLEQRMNQMSTENLPDKKEVLVAKTVAVPEPTSTPTPTPPRTKTTKAKKIKKAEELKIEEIELEIQELEKKLLSDANADKAVIEPYEILETTELVNPEQIQFPKDDFVATLDKVETPDSTETPDNIETHEPRIEASSAIEHGLSANKNARDKPQPTFNGPKLKPYIMGIKIPGKMKKVVAVVKQHLIDANFSIVGEYSPYRRATILAITHDDLKKLATNTSTGAYGAVLRVSVTESGSGVQVLMLNPLLELVLVGLKFDCIAPNSPFLFHNTMQNHCQAWVVNLSIQLKNQKRPIHHGGKLSDKQLKQRENQ